MFKIIFACILIILCIVAYFNFAYLPEEERPDGEFVYNYAKEFCV